MQNSLSSALGRGLLTLQGRTAVLGDRLGTGVTEQFLKLTQWFFGKIFLVLAWNMGTFAERQACWALPCHLQPQPTLQATRRQSLLRDCSYQSMWLMERTDPATMAWDQSGGILRALADGAENVHGEEKGAWVTLDPLC